MKFASWNIRGLNDPNKRFLVKDFVLRQSIDVIGIQESKLCKPNARKLRSMGGNRLSHWSILDSTESRGGVMVGWSNSFNLIRSYVGIFSVSVSFLHITSNWLFTFTNVYAPIDREDKEDNSNSLSVDWAFLYPDQNSNLSSLEASFSEEEVKHAVFSMNPNKAPGPDGFSLLFYQSFWDLIKSDLVALINFFGDNPSSLHRVNRVLITLIPKSKDIPTVKDFRPISLINCIFKIFTKALAIRLAPIMQDLIAPSQSAFQKGRSTLDSILIANEMIHFCSKRKKEVAMVKIDFAKAFDSISWNFLINLLKARGFGDKWCSWIYYIVSTSNCSVLVNGSPSKSFTCKRGLKQGDPLSPLLFNLSVDVLSRMIMYNVDEGLLSSLQIREPLNHIRILQFADDTLLFVRSTLKDISALKAILYIFEDISGLGINYSKSSLLYFGNIQNRGLSLSSALNCRFDSLPIKYLGLPLKRGKLSKSDWQPLLNNLHHKLASWKCNCLSYGGRLVLLNSVLTSIPLYFMSFYKLPGWLIKEVDKIRRNFLWSGKSVSKPFKCLVNWKRVCMNKLEGGLGVKDLKTFNISLLSKWLWKCLDRDSYIGAFLYHLYVRKGSSLQSVASKASNSLVWNDIISNKYVFLQLLSWSLGSGDKIRFWEDKWIGKNSLSSLYPSLYSLAWSNNVSIRSQGNLQNNNWHWHPLLKRSITSVPHSVKLDFMNCIGMHKISNQVDIPLWSLTSNGLFSVKSLYDFLISRGIKSSTYSIVWNPLLPSKIQIFTWLLSMNRLHTKDNLLKKGWQGDPLCVFCKSNPETAEHIFFSCNFASNVWKHFSDYHLPFTWPYSLEDLMLYIASLDKKEGILWKCIFPIEQEEERMICVWLKPYKKDLFHGKEINIYISVEEGWR
ncbi:uncharacterized protein LOC109830826 [Asparagus officinalis]|uniref:uncharacterized protein LOC109830826 n=1 Tax=Asparagus officinalis TaxID=4686 RepID=UPI00098E744D|nr:uncharacterized protein LOC109830826 [Asparagus officinalis]